MRILLLPKLDQNTVTGISKDSCCQEIFARPLSFAQDSCCEEIWSDGRCFRIAICQDGRSVKKAEPGESAHFHALLRKLWPSASAEECVVRVILFSFDDDVGRQLKIIETAHLFYFCGFDRVQNRMPTTILDELRGGVSTFPPVQRLRERIRANELIYTGTCGGGMLAGDTYKNAGGAGLDLLFGLHVAYESGTAPEFLQQKTGDGQMLLTSGCGIAVLMRGDKIRTSSFVVTKNGKAKWSEFARKNSANLQQLCQEWFPPTAAAAASGSLQPAAAFDQQQHATRTTGDSLRPSVGPANSSPQEHTAVGKSDNRDGSSRGDTGATEHCAARTEKLHLRSSQPSGGRAWESGGSEAGRWTWGPRDERRGRSARTIDQHDVQTRQETERRERADLFTAYALRRENADADSYRRGQWLRSADPDKEPEPLQWWNKRRWPRKQRHMHAWEQTLLERLRRGELQEVVRAAEWQ